MNKAVSGIMLSLLILTSMLTFAFNIKPTKAEWGGAVHIRADGSIDPPTAPITTYDFVTYALTDNIKCSADGIVVERNNIIIDGAGYILQGSGISDSKGIDISGAHNVTVKNATIQNFWFGIYICSSRNSITENKITNNYLGIYICSSNNSVYRNIIANNKYGISIFGGDYIGSENNSIYENDIEYNDCGISLGVWAWESSSIFHNNFIKNVVQVSNMGTTNVWDDGFSSGNYWSDYTGYDADRDCIGDTPYVIDTQNIDHYPLMYAFMIPVAGVWTDKLVYYVGDVITIHINPTPPFGAGFYLIINVPDGTNLRYDFYPYEDTITTLANYSTGQYKVELWMLIVYPEAIPELLAYCFFEVKEPTVRFCGIVEMVDASPTEPSKGPGDWEIKAVEVFEGDNFIKPDDKVWVIYRPFVEGIKIDAVEKGDTVEVYGRYNIEHNKVELIHNLHYLKKSNKYILHVQSSPITGIQISYSGDFSGTGTTNVDIGPKDSPFTVTLTAPLTYQDYAFNHWELDGVDVGSGLSMTVKVNDERKEKVATAVYSKGTIKYTLHVKSEPVSEVTISYDGDYSGVSVTNFDVGPKDAPFMVTLNAPLVYQDYKFSYWLLDGVNMGQSNSITVKIDDEKRERTAVAVYSKEVIEYTLHVKSEPVLGVSISYSGDYSGTGTTSFDIGPKNSCFRVVLTAPSEFQNYKFVYWYIPELKLITVENPFICYHLKAYTSFNELTAIAVFSKDTSVIDLKTVPVDYTGVITLVERGFEEYAGTQELKFNVDQKLTNLIAWFYISRYNWHPEGPLSTPKEYPNINFNIRISSPQGTEYSVTMNTSRGFTDVWIPIPEPAQGSWTMKIIAFTEDSVSTKCKYSLSIREDKSSIVKPLTVINLKTGKAEEKFGCSLWVQARSKYEKVNPLMPSHKEPFAYYISTTLHSDLGLEKNFPNILAVGFDDALGSICDKPVLCIDRGKSEGYEEIVSLTEDPNVEFAAKWSFEIVKILSSIVEYGTDIVEFLEDLHGLYVQEIFKPVVKEAFTLYEKLDENKLDLINFDVPASLNGWSSSDRTRRFWTYCNLSLAPSSDFIIYTCLALLHESGEYYYIKPQTFEFKISGTTLGATYANVKSNNGMETLISHEDTVVSNTSILTYQHNSSRHVMLATSSEEVTDLGSVPLQYTGTMKLEVGLGGQRIGDEYFSFDVPQDFENIIVEVNILADGATPDLDSVDVFVYDEQRKITYEAEVFPREKSDMAIAIPQPKQFGQKWGISIYAWAPLWTSSFRYSIKVEEDPNSIVKPLTLINAETKQPDAQYGSGASLWIQAKDLQTNKPIHPLKLPAHGEVEYTMIIQLPASCWIIEDYPNVVSLAYDDVLGEIKMDKAASREIGWEAGWRDANVAKDQYVQFALKWGVVYPISKIPVIGTYISFIELLKDLFDLKIKDYYKQAVEKSYNLYKTAMNENQFDIINFFIPARLTWYDYAYMAKFIVPLKLSPTSSLRIFLTLAAKYQNPVKTTYYYVEPQYFDFSISGTKVSLQEQQHKIHLKVYDDMGNCIGFDPSIGRTKEEIEGARYIDFMNGTTIIVIPPEYKDLQIIVDASNAEEQQEYYNLTMTYITQNGSQIANNFQGVICKNELQKLKVNISGSSINIEEIKEAIPWWIQHQLWIIAGVMVAAVVATATFALIRKQKRHKTKVNL